jgi:hypothetical protein
MPVARSPALPWCVGSIRGDGRRKNIEFFNLNRWRGLWRALRAHAGCRPVGAWARQHQGRHGLWRCGLESFARHTEVRLAYPDGIARIEQRFEVSWAKSIGYILAPANPGRTQ